ncbi:MAG TPA: chemotaxis protein CheB [Kofleriaceae bacterium]|jgi:two-component system chemotaxis response regulator CheB
MSPAIFLIGGSAGALDPMLSVIGALPDTLAMPIVIVLHLARNPPNLVPQLLAHITSRRIEEIEDKMQIQDHEIYVAPPNYHVLLERSRSFALSVDEPVHFSRPSIDVSFESAAEVYGAGTAALLLSGANEDGAAGLSRIRAAGGLALVQAPADASHRTMPLAALRGGARPLPIAEVAQVLVSHYLEDVA